MHHFETLFGKTPFQSTYPDTKPWMGRLLLGESAFFRRALAYPIAVCIVLLPILSGITTAAELTDIEVGYGGIYKVGRSTAVRATLSPAVDGVRLELDAADPSGCISTIIGQEGKVIDGKTALLTYFRPGRLDAALTLRAVDADGNTVAERTLSSKSNGGELNVALDRKSVV